ncbi:N-acetylneuraminate synthase [Clostridium botulinum]|uniref:N-acetylneuraminate synthase n=1 Tax=Clostridium botulinum TaxID=1491 RepID=UPI0007748D5A|nr:N-acetylneuraminate synthase [Clostridium botulinum]MBY6930058.1 N-acetylneuraminate synthase [Clostridium botulinum]NFG19251.1 N-acetylneuraminate synthase [Clostridium botulinum]NFL85683.1 N-acetylneuraminate synthase [Clostridium botulinum]NFO20241.1 N-acetylneuraminate synthase [Clostridium botulinum]NFO80278.1 N-acetylneuraminate synthase [Clostridium botulinum]
MGVFIIAEAGVNHNGDINLAKKLVDMAKECGADAVKFQTFKAEESTGSFAEKAKYQKENDKTEESQLEMIKKLELPFEKFKEIKEYCDKRGIIFVSTPDGIESLNYLIGLNVDFIKIGSSEVTNINFLKAIGDTGKPVILSTGMSTLGEVEKAIDAIYSTGNRNVRLMHCTSDYPTKVEDVNLRAMVTLREAFKVPVGLSDHTLGFESAVSATTLGAEFIEKHITLDKKMKGPDHKASMMFDEFKEYIIHIKNTEKLLGDGIKRPTEKEKVIMNDARRSVLASRDLKKGTIIEKDMIVFKRPGYGIRPELSYILVGRELKRDILKDEVIMWEDV